jgi:hypothetical protein
VNLKLELNFTASPTFLRWPGLQVARLGLGGNEPGGRHRPLNADGAAIALAVQLPGTDYSTLAGLTNLTCWRWNIPPLPT